MKGPIKSGRVRATKTDAELWRREDLDAAVPVIGTGRWVLHCKTHAKARAFTTQRAARDIFSHPSGWCVGCGYELDSPIDTIIEASAHKAGERVRLDELDSLQAGDIVSIDGERGNFRVVYIDAFEDVKRPPEVTLIGGLNGRNAFRTVVLARCKPKA